MKFLRRLLNRIPFILCYLFLLSLVFPSPALAACKETDFSCLETIFTRVLNYAIAGASIAFFIMILSGGLKWLTSSGDPKDLENAKGRITFAVLGLFLMILAWFILKFIAVFTFTTGTVGPITIFEIPKP